MKLELNKWYWYGATIVKIIAFPPNQTLVVARTYDNKEMEIIDFSLHKSYIKEEFVGTLPKIFIKHGVM